MLEINKHIIAKELVYCNSIFSKAMGLRFKKIKSGQGYVFRFDVPVKAMIDMWFVWCSIDVLFLDENNKIIEMKRNFRPFAFYSSKNKANTIIELEKDTIDKFNIKPGQIAKFK